GGKPRDGDECAAAAETAEVLRMRMVGEVGARGSPGHRAREGGDEEGGGEAEPERPGAVVEETRIEERQERIREQPAEGGRSDDGASPRSASARRTARSKSRYAEAEVCAGSWVPVRSNEQSRRATRSRPAKETAHAARKRSADAAILTAAAQAASRRRPSVGASSAARACARIIASPRRRRRIARSRTGNVPGA